MFRTVRIVSAALTASLLLGGCSWLPWNDDPEPVAIALSGGVTAEVTAETGEGELTHEVSAPPADVLFTKAVTDAVHLGVRNGKLEGPATISFRVPDDLKPPPGLDIGDAVTIATKGDEPDAEWRVVGGDYDPGTRTISVRSEHFSYWTMSVIDPAAIQREAERAKRLNKAGVVSKFVVDTIAAPAPPLTCPPQLPLVAIPLSDPAYPGLGVCMAEDAAANRYHLEIVNKHDFPIKLQLPPGITKQNEANPATNAFYDLYRKLAETEGNLLLQPHEKRVLSVDKAQVSDTTKLSGSIDDLTVLFDMVAGVVDIFADVSGQDLSLAQRALLDTGSYTCIRQMHEEHKASQQAGKKDIGNWDLVRNTMVECLPVFLDQAKALWELTAKAIGKSVTQSFKTVFKAITILFDLPDIVRLAKEYVNTLLLRMLDVANRLINGGTPYGIEIRLKPLSLTMRNALPDPREAGIFIPPSMTDPRVIAEVSATVASADAFSIGNRRMTREQFYLTDCLRPGAPQPQLDWIFSTGNMQGATADYNLADNGVVWGSIHFELYQLRSPGAADNNMATYIRNLQDFCPTVRSVDGTIRMRANDMPPLTVLHPTADTAGRLYVVTTSSREFIGILSVSGNWMLTAQIKLTDRQMGHDQATARVNRLMQVAYQRADRELGSHFTG